MSSDGAVYMQLFRKTLLISVFLDLAVLPLSLVITPDFFVFTAGLICGWAAALIKLYFTFRGVYHMTAEENAELKKKITNSVLNAASYVLIGGILVFSAIQKDSMFFGAAAGSFNVYFAVLIYSIYKAVRNGHR